MSPFQKSVLTKHLAAQDQAAIDEAFVKFESYFLDSKRQKNIRAKKEEQFQEGFLRELFVKIFGYTISPDPSFNLETELKNISDSKKADGAILHDGQALGVIELKCMKTKNLDKVEVQAFGYKNKQPGCVYVITSNFRFLRFYIETAVDPIEFDLFTLNREQFGVLYLILEHQNLLSGIPLELKRESLLKEKEIETSFYSDYSKFKSDLWQDMVLLNPSFDRLELYKKSQKLIDRFLFLLFGEDKGLLPPNLISKVVDRWTELKRMDEYRSLYQIFQKHFSYLNDGYAGSDYSISAYNGGLFKPDVLLDSIDLSDDILKKHVLQLTEYDFESQVDTNILGHIFEHSLNDIEAVRAEILGEKLDKKKSKKKKDGVYYTPKYVTRYIVERTLGKLCSEKKIELDIDEDDYTKNRKGRRKETITRLSDKLASYRKWLAGVTICDPACGSGAFLNETLEFLIKEHRYIKDLENQLLGYAIDFPDLEKEILEQNIFGVDINEESVEIARLSLWLRTAKKGRKLNTLSDNIKVGNSLIDSPKIDAELAFDWQKEFPKVFANGGFDIVLGNPPYVDIKALDDSLVEALFDQYDHCQNRINLYSVFIERGLMLTKQGGFLSYINPNSILLNSSYKSIRKRTLPLVDEIIKLPDCVFPDAQVETIIFTLRMKENFESLTSHVYAKDATLTEIDPSIFESTSKAPWIKNVDSTFNIFINEEQVSLLEKIESNRDRLESVADFCLGITPYDKHQGHSPETIESREFHSDVKLSEDYKPLISGANITRYQVSPDIVGYLKYGDWLGAPREERFFTEPRVLVRQIVSGNPPRIYAGYTEAPLYYTQIGFGIIPKSSSVNAVVLTAFLNCRVINFYHKYRFLDLEKVLFQKILIGNAKRFPIPNFVEEPRITDVEQLASQLIKKAKQLSEVVSSFCELMTAKFSIDKLSNALLNWADIDASTFLDELSKKKVTLSLEEEAKWLKYLKSQQDIAASIQMEIQKAEGQVDSLFYQLFELNDEDIRIIESSL